MFKNCQEWRQSVEGIGIDELYKSIDPFDVSDQQCPASFMSMFS
jgi:hypothetical protein